MNPETRHPAEELEKQEDSVEEALLEAGLSHVKAPKLGTLSHERLLAAAHGYMTEVTRGAEKISMPDRSGYSDREDYYRPKDEAKRLAAISSSDTKRREYHDQLSVMLLGRRRNELSQAEANQLSNFAAYITGHEEYLDTWRE